MSKKHKVFISYHHENDEKYRNRFENLFSNHYDVMDSRAVQFGDVPHFLSPDATKQKIREKFLRESTVTVVLIGEETFRRAYVDWEISASIRHTDFNPRSGLLGIVLPGRSDFNKSYYDEDTIPARLADNIDCEFAKIYDWSRDPNLIKEWIHTAFKASKNTNPTNNSPALSMQPIYSPFINRFSYQHPYRTAAQTVAQSIYNRSGRNYGH